MSFRTVVVSRRCKLDLKMGYLVIRDENRLQRIFISEIDSLILENPACAVTGCLLVELIKNHVNVIICDHTHSPLAEFAPLYGHSDSPRKLREQLDWNKSFAAHLWTFIVAEKIRNQAVLLQELHHDEAAALLISYFSQLQSGDLSNREGHAAKVYFNALFGKDFIRGTPDAVNSALDYGYTVLLSAFNREIVICGFDTRLGIAHCNVFNRFNLSCDLMEPYRILIDRLVLTGNFVCFDRDAKHKLLEIFNLELEIGGSRQTFLNSIRIYVRSVFRALAEENLAEIKFYRLVSKCGINNE